MSVEASFIDSLIAATGDSDGGSGDSDPNVDSGGGEGAGDTGSGEPGANRVPPGGDPASKGTQPPAGVEPVPASGKQPATQTGAAAPAAETPKPADDPVTQIEKQSAALRMVRGENKQLKSQFEAQAAQIAALEERIKALATPPAKATEEDPDPDFLTDPKGYVDTNVTKTREALKKLEQGEAERAEATKKQQEQAAEQERLQGQWNEVIAKETEFAAATPDYQDAIQFVRNLRIQAFTLEYEAIHDKAPTNAEISKALTTQEIQGALTLQQKGKNPAQWYYGYAKSLGYKPAAPAAAPAVETPPAAKAPPPKPDKEAVRGMGSGGGDNTPPDDSQNKDPMAEMLAGVHGEMTQKRRARRG